MPGSGDEAALRGAASLISCHLQRFCDFGLKFTLSRCHPAGTLAHGSSGGGARGAGSRMILGAAAMVQARGTVSQRGCGGRTWTEPSSDYEAEPTAPEKAEGRRLTGRRTEQVCRRGRVGTGGPACRPRGLGSWWRGFGTQERPLAEAGDSVARRWTGEGGRGREG